MHVLIAIPFWQWDDKDLELQADVDRFVEDGSLDENVESFLSHDDTNPGIGPNNSLCVKSVGVMCA